MAFDPQNDPTKNPEHNGKVHRYVKRTSCVRTIRNDPEAEQAMWLIRKMLSVTSAHNREITAAIDAPSFSLIVRRSLKLYRDLLVNSESAVVAQEQRLVRENSHLPVVGHAYTEDYRDPNTRPKSNNRPKRAVHPQ